MKKRKCQQYLKLVMLLFGVTLVLSSCQKDDTDYLENQAALQKPSKYAIEILTHRQVKSNEAVFKELQKFTPKLENSSANSLNREIYNSDYGFTVNTDFVKYIEDTETGLNSFNFLISRDSVVTQNVENLLLQSNNDGGYDAYIVEYEFTKEEYSALNEAFLSSTTTKYSPINFNTSVFNTGELSKVPELICIETWTLLIHSTPRDDSHSYEWVSSTTCGFVDGGGGSSSGDSPTSPGNDGGPTTGGGSGGGANNDNSDPNELELPNNPCKENCIEIVTVPVVPCPSPNQIIMDELNNITNSWSFLEDCELGNSISSDLSFESYDGLVQFTQDLINSRESGVFGTTETPIAGEAIAHFTFHDMLFHYSILVNQDLGTDYVYFSDYSVNSVATSIAGGTMFLSWNQSSYSNNLSGYSSITDVYGVTTLYVLYKGFPIKFDFDQHFRVTTNATDGSPMQQEWVD